MNFPVGMGFTPFCFMVQSNTNCKACSSNDDYLLALVTFKEGELAPIGRYYI